MESRQAPVSATERQAHWRDVVAAGNSSNLSIREFCRQHDIRPSQFYYWRQRLAGGAAQSLEKSSKRSQEARFALVRTEAAPVAPVNQDGVLELVLKSGWRLHIRPGVDKATLRTVLSALAPEA